jgi:hypothetical protein
MKMFIWVTAIMLSIEVMGQSVMLKNHDYKLNPLCMVADLYITIAMLLWAAWLLGSNA